MRFMQEALLVMGNPHRKYVSFISLVSVTTDFAGLHAVIILAV